LYGDKRDLGDMPNSQTTDPAVLFKPHTEKRQLVPYNAERALELLMRRDPLPPLFNSPTDVTEISKGTIGRDELVIKHPTADDLMRRTRCDEG
jgi:anaerobic dimethyl sulfoxide reductase subunit B (iron-sulfur subunit)